MKTHKIGAHVSAAGGLYKALERVHAIGGNCLQLFSGSPRVWKKPALDSIDTKQFFATQEKLAIQPVFTHALYLINLASDKPESVEKSINSLIYELSFDGLIKGAGVVVHLGSHQGRGWEAVKDQLAESIHTILKKTPDNSTFLIENSAGQNGKIASDLQEIRWLLDQVKSPRLGWCFDTCHAFAAGYKLSPLGREHLDFDLQNPDKRGDGNLKIVEQEIQKLNLWSTLQCVHVNDSRDPFDSGRDRHANLGEGNIPIEDLTSFLHLEQLKDIPFILEVPGFDNQGPDKQNIDILKNIVK